MGSYNFPRLNWPGALLAPYSVGESHAPETVKYYQTTFVTVGPT